MVIAPRLAVMKKHLQTKNACFTVGKTHIFIKGLITVQECHKNNKIDMIPEQICDLDRGGY